MRRWLQVMALALALLAGPGTAWATGSPATPPAATPPAATPPAVEAAATPGLLSEAEYILAKTATYEIGTSLLETGVFVAFFGGGLGTAGGAFGLVLASTAMVYLVHEIAWEAWLPPDAERDDAGLVTSKTITYRILDTLRAFTLGSALSGAQLAGSVAYTATLTVAELVLYAANEVAFARLRPVFLAPE